MKFLVHVEDSLDKVVPRLEIGERVSRIANGFRIHHQRLACGNAVGIDAKALSGKIVLRKLHARLFLVVFRKDQYEVAMERLM